MATVKKAVGKAAPAKKGPAAKAPAKKGPPAKPARKGAAPARKRKPLPVFEAPADFKAHFLLVSIRTERDGLLGSQVQAVRYQGKFDWEAEDKKKSDMAAYDMPTVVGIASRLAAVTFKTTNDKKYSQSPKERDGVKGAHRLPRNTVFHVLMRVSKRAADNSLTCGIRTIWQPLKNATTGRVKRVELEKTDPAYRMIRKASRFLPAAFTNVQMPPKRSRRKAAEEAEEE